MEQALEHFFSGLHWSLLGIIIALSLLVLGKAADKLVDEAVALSERSGIPKIVIGATIVSLGTTTPEAAVSVFAAIQGSPGLAPGKRRWIGNLRYRADTRSGLPNCSLETQPQDLQPPRLEY